MKIKDVKTEFNYSMEALQKAIDQDGSYEIIERRREEAAQWAAIYLALKSSTKGL
jgi:hypothetical protein